MNTLSPPLISEIELHLAVQRYIRGRLEYGRFLRQAQRLANLPAEVSNLETLTRESVLDLYPRDRPFGDMEQGKIVILSCYDATAEDEEVILATISAFLQQLTQSSLLPKLIWTIGAEETELETVNLLLSYALLAGSIEKAEQTEALEVSDADSTDATPATNLEDQIRICSLEDVRLAWTDALCPFDAFWSGLGEFSVTDPDAVPLLRMSWEFDESNSLAVTLLQAWQKFRQARQEEAQANVQQEAWSQAVAGYRKVVRYGGWESLEWHNLGVALLKSRQLPLAFRANQVAIELDPSIPKYYNIQGIIAESLGHRDLAQALYQTCINQDPTYDQGYLNLGFLFQKEKNLNLAAEIYHQGLQNIQTSFALYTNLANLIYAQGNLELAQRLYEKALSCDDRDCIQVLDVFNSLDTLAEAMGKINLQETYVRMRNDFVRSNLYNIVHLYMNNHKQGYLSSWYYFDLSIYFQSLFKYKEINKLACKFLKKNEFYHKDIYFLNASIPILSIHGYTETVNKLLDCTSFFENMNPVIKKFIKSCLFCPIYTSFENIKEIREAINNSLNSVTFLDLDLDLESNIRYLMFMLTKNLSFYLIYQQFNETKFNSRYSEISRRILEKYLPCNLIEQQVDCISVDKKIRIGYISAHFMGNHSGTVWSLGWMQNHNREKFEIYCYSLSLGHDSGTERFQQCSDYFKKSDANWQEFIKTILADKLHILIFTDIGMEFQSLLLCNLRLAPIQCTAWGHPLTSGSSNIDYYLSGDAIEPENAQEHYSSPKWVVFIL